VAAKPPGVVAPRMAGVVVVMLVLAPGTHLRWQPHAVQARGTAPHRTAPHRTAPHRTAPHRTAPHRTAPHRTAQHRTHRPLRSSRNFACSSKCENSLLAALSTARSSSSDTMPSCDRRVASCVARLRARVYVWLVGVKRLPATWRGT
jgi:hypothetical protein